MSYTAVFRDGPLGGQFREMPDAQRVIQVPVFRRASSSERYPIFGPHTAFDTEEYELAGAQGRVIEYRWRNPAEALREENRRLRAKIADARAALD